MVVFGWFGCSTDWITYCGCIFGDKQKNSAQNDDQIRFLFLHNTIRLPGLRLTSLDHHSDHHGIKTSLLKGASVEQTLFHWKRLMMKVSSQIEQRSRHTISERSRGVLLIRRKNCWSHRLGSCQWRQRWAQTLALSVAFADCEFEVNLAMLIANQMGAKTNDEFKVWISNNLRWLEEGF